MSRAINNLWDSLERLKNGNPLRVSSPYKINNDTVAVEAGLKRGAVKRSRPELFELLIAIKEAEKVRQGVNFNPIMKKTAIKHNKLVELEQKVDDLNNKYEVSLVQINALICENLRLKAKLAIIESKS